MMQQVYEVVNATDDEVYYSIGLWGSKTHAIGVASLGDEPPVDIVEDYYELEVRQRPLGDFSEQGKVIAKVSWKYVVMDDPRENGWESTVELVDDQCVESPKGANG